jgi:hypothetical protein
MAIRGVLLVTSSTVAQSCSPIESPMPTQMILEEIRAAHLDLVAGVTRPCSDLGWHTSLLGHCCGRPQQPVQLTREI